VNFAGNNGASPLASLVQGTDGNLYGVTFEGGANNYGTAYKITPGGTLTTLYSFDISDGRYPSAALVQSANGRFYGTAQEGGANLSGAIFRMTASGSPMALHSFDIGDGSLPAAGLIQDANNQVFYGTAREGGAYKYGTVFGITPAGVLTTLHNFRGIDGANPDGNLIQGDDGTFYGTTENGGANCLPNGCGAIFRITPGGTLTTLHSFNRTDGALPEAGLFQAVDGNFYGTTVSGGAGNYGTVFRLTPRGVVTTLHSFDGNDGAYPFSQLIQGTDGELYGTTTTTIFRITSSGALTTLYTFDYSPNGGGPSCGLVQATDGNFYGTTLGGGTSNLGTVFSLSSGLGPFVRTLPASGKVGSTVKILGTDLTGAARVDFNGIAATFTVVSLSLITTIVPSSASAGAVQVVTPDGTLSSNVPFLVR
jgi:uncharacterized repeat protein (TIGR03803 family)